MGIQNNHPLSIEVIYITSSEQTCIALNLPENTSVLEAIEQSAILKKHPDIDLNQNKIGIFGKLVTHETKLKHGDRIEIYRPLALDPKQKRFLKVKRHQ